MYHHIEPLPDTALFDVGQLTVASQKAARDPGKLSDYELRMLATYDMGAAQAAARSREQVLTKALQPVPAPSRPAANATGMPPVYTKADSAGGISAWCRKHAARAAPLWLIDTMLDCVKEIHVTLRKRLDSADVSNATRDAALASLEARVAELESATTKSVGVNNVRWAGVHEVGKPYHEGSLCTRGGLWLAKTTTTSMPGSSMDWQLIVRAKSKDVE